MPRILLIDDNGPLRRTLEKVLQRNGYQVQVAADGGAALKLFVQQPFDLVITDLIMPGKEGLETIIELRHLQPALKVIAMSGGGLGNAGDYLAMARTLGATHALAKPFPYSQLLETVARELGGGPCL